MSTGTTIHESRTLRRNVTWQEYVALRDGDEFRNTRMTYDRGSLELMSPSRLHERLRIVITECLKAWCREMRISYQSCGSTTFRREDLERGLEPDNCYYIQNLAVVKGRAAELDLTIDPPPDLALEIDVTSKLTRQDVDLRGAWRWQDEALHILRLSSDGQYFEVSASQALPGCPCERLVELVKRRTAADETTLIREFRAACRASGA